MVVFRSNKQIYVQVVDDLQGKTLCAAASNDKELAAQCKGKTGIEAAAIVGKAVAERALAKGITTICFDRGGYLFHGFLSFVPINFIRTKSKKHSLCIKSFKFCQESFSVVSYYI